MDNESLIKFLKEQRSKDNPREYVNEQLQKIWNSIVEKSLEYKTFKLGYASAYYSFYETFCKEYGDETADKMFGVNKDDKEPFLHEFYEMVQIRKETVDKSSD